ncbi:Gfo/Idh/MocA family protein [Bacillus xiapuensis]|uniref:Gfo/Idh/MocA family protein n=1 Tax=Bacillus xiapuensis TaxID=2014075 RepID=UPI000C243C7C|nr:Gfo/Idh/MocA family oxidoreductase [Bacillus xiapuensis]
MNIHWGILSAANIAYEEVVPALRRSKQAIVSAVASKSKEKAERFNVPKIYRSYEELINDPGIEALYIPLPNSLHKEWAVKAMNAGKHVLLEKPAVLTEADMLEVKAVSEANGTVFMEAFMYQFHRQHNKVKELLKSGIIGDYRHVKAHFSWQLTNPDDIRLNRELGGGAMWDVGCYGMHAVTQLIGMKPVKVSMSGSLHPNHPIDMTSHCFLVDDQGRTAEVTASMELPFIDRFEIIGPKGSIFVDSAFRPDVSLNKRGKVYVKDSKGNIILQETFEDDPYLNQIEHFQACITERKTPIYHVDCSLELIRYLEKAYQSMNQNSIPVEIG